MVVGSINEQRKSCTWSIRHNWQVCRHDNCLSSAVSGTAQATSHEGWSTVDWWIWWNVSEANPTISTWQKLSEEGCGMKKRKALFRYYTLLRNMLSRKFIVAWVIINILVCVQSKTCLHKSEWCCLMLCFFTFVCLLLFWWHIEIDTIMNK